jgi:hypothetical protein
VIKDFFLAVGGLYFGAWLFMLALILITWIRQKIKAPKRNNINKDIQFNDSKKTIEPTAVVVEKINSAENVEVENNCKKNIDESKLQNKYDELSKILRESEEKFTNIPLLVVGSLIGIEATNIIGKNIDFPRKFEESVKELLQFQKFKIITNGRISLNEYIYSSPELIEFYHDICSHVLLDRFIGFLNMFKEYFDFIDQNKELLISKKRIYIKEDEFGDQVDMGWIDYLQRFAERRNLIIKSDYPDDVESVVGYLKLLNVDNFEGKSISYLLAICEHYAKKEDKFASIYTGVDFELYLKSTIEDSLEGAYVETTPASGDHGADLLVKYKGITIAIQAKYYSGSVGNAAVQEIHAGIGFYDADFGMVVTQSTYTEHAKSLAGKLGIHLEGVETFIDKIKSLAS